MKLFLIKLGLFLALNAAVALAALVILDTRYSFEQYETDSLLLSTPRNTHFDLVILGTSHARVFNRIKHNHDFLTHELDMKILNLAIPFGGGVLLEKMYVANFFDCGNETDTILYFLDPFVFFSPMVNKYHKFVYYEPFRLSFLIRMLKNRMPPERIFTYIRSKFSYRWVTQKPGLVAYDDITLDTYGIELDPERMRARAESLYPDGLNETYFAQYGAALGEILEMARQHGCRTIIAFSPSLLGREKGAPRLLELLDTYREQYDFEFHDFTDAIPDEKLYSDYDHLNSKGVEVLVAQFIKPILRASE